MLFRSLTRAPRDRQGGDTTISAGRLARFLTGDRARQIEEATGGAPPPAPTVRRPAPQAPSMDLSRVTPDNPAGIRFANGGPVRGPGTGTSDSIPARVRAGSFVMPADSTQQIGDGELASMGAQGFKSKAKREAVDVRLSNGEHLLSPEQVHAVGVQALSQMKDETHTPSAQAGALPPHEAVDGHQFFFADGGLVEEPRRPNSFGDAAAAANDSTVRQVATGMPGGVPSSPVAASAPSAQPSLGIGSTPAAAPPPFNPASGVDRPNELGSLADTQAQLKSIASTNVQPAAGSGLSVIGGPAPSSTPAPAAAPVALGFRPGLGGIGRPITTPVQGTAIPSTTPVYRSGNSFADSAEAADLGARPGMGMSDQNMGAADALTTRGALSSQPGMSLGFRPRQYADGGAVTEDDPRKRRPPSFGDAAASAADPATRQVPTGTPQPTYGTTAMPPGWKPPGTRGMNGVMSDALAAAGGPPAVLPTLSGSPPTGNPGIIYEEKGFVPASAPTSSAPPAISAADPSKTGAAFGIYPNPNSRMSSHANDNALARGVTVNAAGTGFQPATPAAPTELRMTSRTDPRSMAFDAGVDPNAAPPTVGTSTSGAPAALGFIPGGAAPAAGNPPATQAQVRAVDNNPANAAAIAAAPAANPEATAGRGFAPGGAERSTNEILASLAASNRDLESRQHPGGPAVIGPADYANRNADFNNGAALRTAAARGSWSPRRGFQADQGAIAAAEMPMKLAAEQAQTAARTVSAEQISAQNNAVELQRTNIRDSGDTARLATREAGDTARNAATTTVAQGQLDLQRTAQGFQTSAARQMQDLQQRYLASKDPAEQATLARQIREYQGKDAPARYKVAAGGQQIDANGVAYKVPDRVFNEQTGQFSDGAATAAQAAPLSNHVAALKKDSKLAAQFDQQYGAGAAARALGTK